MSQIKQISRISHHTLTTTGSTNFTIPSTEDFTIPNAWTSTDLALSEFGILEGHDKLFIRIDDGIFQVPLSTSTGKTGAFLWSAGTGDNVIVQSNSDTAESTGAFTIIGGWSNNSVGDFTLVVGAANSADGSLSIVGGGNNDVDSNGAIVGGYNNIVKGDFGFVTGANHLLTTGATASAIIGGSGITGTTAYTVYVPNFNINYTPDTGTTEDKILVRDSLGTVKEINNVYNYGFYSQTGNSTTVSATTTETSIVGAGVGTLTVPANGFQVGDSFHAKIGGYVSSTNNAELTIRIKTSGTTLFTIGPIILPSMTNQFWENEIDFTIRNIGASGTIQTNGQFVYIQNSGNNYNGYGFNTNTTLDTTIDNTLDITVEWDTTNASNAIMSDLFYLKKVY